jgi:BirA family transcriptional regulator, biotin operon repressor / biotin---[acetyl-CoA-carboxylase] ligase
MIIGSKMIYRENLPSTNSYCSSLLNKGHLQEGTIIHTNFQTSGRGQTGNTWESETDKNLLFSIILYPMTIRIQKQFIISKTISLGICDFLERYLRNVSIKWPNDIYVNNDKIAGILIESSVIRDEIEHVIAGIGLNVNQEKFTAIASNPTSLKILSGLNFDLAELLSVISKDLDRRYKQLLNSKTSEIDEQYIAHLWRYKQWSEFKDSRGEFDGRILSVSDTGRLQIEDRRGRMYEYTFKEVDYL